MDCRGWASTVAVRGRRGGRGRDRIRSLMGSVLDRLQEREAQARVLVEGLREEAERVAGALAAADDSLCRLVVARETVLEVLVAQRGLFDALVEELRDPAADELTHA